LIEADLSNAQLSEANLNGAFLYDANLGGANLSEADLRASYLSNADFYQADLSGADLSGSEMNGVNLNETDLTNADLRRVDLSGANLVNTNLSGANLSGADFYRTHFTKVNLTKAILTNCLIYGISAWDLQLDETIMSDLIITESREQAITVDHIEVAQFIYLLLKNQKIRDVIDTITSKVVLILGRFTPERKIVLDALKDELRKQNYTPVLFDFEKPNNRDLTETVSILAHLARFIIVDLTDPSSAPHEVATVIPLTVVPVQPLISQEPLMVDGKVVERREYAMFEDLRRRYPWVLPTFRYQGIAELLASLQAQIIGPAEQKARELAQPK
jgi:Pentapeptide repeats (8 copies)